MTEYWKSQARKYCEFCKCWFADNKVSISFHENGKKHKESVQKHISQLTKKSTKDAKQKEKIDDEMKKMEAAAMAAYLKDVQNNADLTSQAINDMLGNGQAGSSTNEAISTSNSAPRKPPVWQELKSGDGPTYFWNTETNETTWDPPDEYLSLAQQEDNNLKKEAAEKKKQKLKKEKHKEAVKEANAFVAREQMRELSVKKTEPKPAEGMSFGPAPRAAQPYGSWTPIVTAPVEKIDLQLPKPTKEVLPPPVVMEPEPRAQFTERRAPPLVPESEDAPVKFKKRKLGGARRNMRQKLDDD